MPSLCLGCVSYIRGILRLCEFLMSRRFRNFSWRQFFRPRVPQCLCFSATLLCDSKNSAEINFFADVCYFSCISVSFVCVQYHRLLACVHSIRQHTCFNLQAKKQKKRIITHSAIIYPILVVLCSACHLSRTYPRLFLEGGILI